VRRRTRQLLVGSGQIAGGAAMIGYSLKGTGLGVRYLRHVPLTRFGYWHPTITKLGRSAIGASLIAHPLLGGIGGGASLIAQGARNVRSGIRGRSHPFYGNQYTRGRSAGRSKPGVIRRVGRGLVRNTKASFNQKYGSSVQHFKASYRQKYGRRR